VLSVFSSDRVIASLFDLLEGVSSFK